MDNENKILGMPANQIPDTLDQNTALNILVNSVHVGQSRGAWKLEETELLLKAIRSFVKKDKE
jgi:hypothetical protein